MTTPLHPYPFQEKAIHWLKDKPKAMLALEPGLGKTVVSAIDLRPPAVVVTTSAMIYKFEQELNLWRPDLTTRVVTTKHDPLRTGEDVLIFSWTAMTKFYDQIEIPETLIVDESHYAKSPGARRTKAICKLIEATPRVRLLSGTPVTSRPMDLWALLRAIGATKLDWRNYAFKYCAAFEAPYGFVTTGASRLAELRRRTAPYILRMTKSTYQDQLLTPIRRVIELDAKIPPTEHPYIEACIAQPDNPVPFEAISDIRRLNAELKLPLCIEHIRDLLESEDKIVVFAHHSSIIDTLHEKLIEYNPVVVSGAQSAREKFNAVQMFQNHSKVRVLLGNVAAASEAITLTAASRVVFVEPAWTPAAIDQAISRCHRIGQERQVQADFLITRKSLDSHMLKRCFEKTDIIDQIITETEIGTTPMQDIQLKELAELLRLVADKLEQPAAAAETVEVVEQLAAPAPCILDEPTATLDDVRSAAAHAIGSGNRIRVVDALKELGVANVSKIIPADFNRFIEEVSIV